MREAHLSPRLGEWDQERGDKEPLICNPCLITIRRDMYTEFDLRMQVQSLQTKIWVLSIGLSTASAISGLLIGKFWL